MRQRAPSSTKTCTEVQRSAAPGTLQPRRRPHLRSRAPMTPRKFTRRSNKPLLAPGAPPATPAPTRPPTAPNAHSLSRPNFLRPDYHGNTSVAYTVTMMLPRRPPVNDKLGPPRQHAAGSEARVSRPPPPPRHPRKLPRRQINKFLLSPAKSLPWSAAAPVTSQLQGPIPSFHFSRAVQVAPRRSFLSVALNAGHFPLSPPLRPDSSPPLERARDPPCLQHSALPKGAAPPGASRRRQSGRGGGGSRGPQRQQEQQSERARWVWSRIDRPAANCGALVPVTVPVARPNFCNNRSASQL
ncbi:basic salivary proline-rich protein 4-like [Penaeus indicus]|uniref:basic salivary proline-rich protein 4-like n=1 Tax=Penaeus indicus TaxID=29960 RepID=UPI00300CC693